jgi:hypothetical protein
MLYLKRNLLLIRLLFKKDFFTCFIFVSDTINYVLVMYVLHYIFQISLTKQISSINFNAYKMIVKKYFIM